MSLDAFGSVGVVFLFKTTSPIDLPFSEVNSTVAPTLVFPSLISKTLDT